jgi:murein DD-endopeptidase MepM/ murein hydrolase activator NlpD
MRLALGLCACLIVGLGSSDKVRAEVLTKKPPAARTGAPEPQESVCGEGEFSDDGVCVTWDVREEGIVALDAKDNAHRERSGLERHYAQIPRHPDRPADYDAYVYPAPAALPGGKHVISGYDLDLPDPLQRRGAGLTHVGHGGVDIPGKRNTPIVLIKLEGQVGEATVLYTGPLFGLSVVTVHRVLEGGRERDYLMLHGHLESSLVSAGAHPALGSTLAMMGDSGSPNLVHLHLELRRFREGVIPEAIVKTQGAYALVSDGASIVCDPRNLLPLVSAQKP